MKNYISNYLARRGIKVSIIVPVYNNFMYIGQCIDSIISQTLKEIEIIIVNDGSDDERVLKKIDDFSQTDKRIKVIDKKNTGYGHSLNLGIQLSRGKYIGIVESDDYIDNDMYKFLYEQTKDDIDIVKGGTIFFEQEAKRIQKHPITSSCHPISIFHDKDDYFRQLPINPSGIYRKKFLLDNEIWFSETPGASFQDIGFHFMTSIMANEIRLVPGCFYYYRRDNPVSSILSENKMAAPIYEYSRLNAILNSNIDLKNKYIKYLHLKKFISYKFTLNRINHEYRNNFMLTFKNEWNLALKNNEIDYDLFTDEEIQWINDNLQN